MSTPTFYERQKWGIAVYGLAGLALSVSIAAAAEIKSFNLEDARVISKTIASKFPSPAISRRATLTH